MLKRDFRSVCSAAPCVLHVHPETNPRSIASTYHSAVLSSSVLNMYTRRHTCWLYLYIVITNRRRISSLFTYMYTRFPYVQCKRERGLCRERCTYISSDITRWWTFIHVSVIFVTEFEPILSYPWHTRELWYRVSSVRRQNMKQQTSKS